MEHNNFMSQHRFLLQVYFCVLLYAMKIIIIITMGHENHFTYRGTIYKVGDCPKTVLVPLTLNYTSIYMCVWSILIPSMSG